MRNFVIIEPITHVKKRGLLTPGRGPSTGVTRLDGAPLVGSGRGRLAGWWGQRQNDVRRKLAQDILAVRSQLLHEDLQPPGCQQPVD